MSNVSVTQVKDTVTLISIFQGMVESFGYLVKHNKEIPKVVVVDTCSLFLYRDLATSQHFGRLLITHLSTAMGQLATQFSIAVVVTNHEVRPFSRPLSGGTKKTKAEFPPAAGSGLDQGKPGLGLLWSPQVNVRVRLKMFRWDHAGGAGLASSEASEKKKGGEKIVVCRATLIKSSTGACCGREAWMKVDNTMVVGIENPLEGELRDIAAWD